MGFGSTGMVVVGSSWGRPGWSWLSIELGSIGTVVVVTARIGTSGTGGAASAGGGCRGEPERGRPGWLAGKQLGRARHGHDGDEGGAGQEERGDPLRQGLGSGYPGLSGRNRLPVPRTPRTRGGPLPAPTRLLDLFRGTDQGSAQEQRGHRQEPGETHQVGDRGQEQVGSRGQGRNRAF